MFICGKEYTTGVDRNKYARSKHPEKLVAHLYLGDFHHPKGCMCKNGYRKDEYNSYSIFRNLPFQPICKVCLRRAEQNKKTV